MTIKIDRYLGYRDNNYKVERAEVIDALPNIGDEYEGSIVKRVYEDEYNLVSHSPLEVDDGYYELYRICTADEEGEEYDYLVAVLHEYTDDEVDCIC